MSLVYLGVPLLSCRMNVSRAALDCLRVLVIVMQLIFKLNEIYNLIIVFLRSLCLNILWSTRMNRSLQIKQLSPFTLYYSSNKVVMHAYSHVKSCLSFRNYHLLDGLRALYLCLFRRSLLCHTLLIVSASFQRMKALHNLKATAASNQ